MTLTIKTPTRTNWSISLDDPGNFGTSRILLENNVAQLTFSQVSMGVLYDRAASIFMKCYQTNSWIRFDYQWSWCFWNRDEPSVWITLLKMVTKRTSDSVFIFAVLLPLQPCSESNYPLILAAFYDPNQNIFLLKKHSQFRSMILLCTVSNLTITVFLIPPFLTLFGFAFHRHGSINCFVGTPQIIPISAKFAYLQN